MPEKSDYTELIKRLREWPRACVEYDGSVDQLHDQAAGAIEELQTVLDSYCKRMWAGSNWISVKERLPEDADESVLIYGKWIGRSGTEYKEIWLASMSEFKYQGYTPIAWMPLPEPPEE